MEFREYVEESLVGLGMAANIVFLEKEFPNEKNKIKTFMSNDSSLSLKDNEQTVKQKYLQWKKNNSTTSESLVGLGMAANIESLKKLKRNKIVITIEADDDEFDVSVIQGTSATNKLCKNQWEVRKMINDRLDEIL